MTTAMRECFALFASILFIDSYFNYCAYQKLLVLMSYKVLIVTQ